MSPFSPPAFRSFNSERVSSTVKAVYGPKSYDIENGNKIQIKSNEEDNLEDLDAWIRKYRHRFKPVDDVLSEDFITEQGIMVTPGLKVMVVDARDPEFRTEWLSLTQITYQQGKYKNGEKSVNKIYSSSSN